MRKQINKDKIRMLVKKHGGEFHGPNVEHLSIPESNFWNFIEEISKECTGSIMEIDHEHS